MEQTEEECHAETLLQELTHEPLELSAKQISHHCHLLILLLSFLFNRSNQALLQVRPGLLGKTFRLDFSRLDALPVGQDLTNSVKKGKGEHLL